MYYNVCGYTTVGLNDRRGAHDVELSPNVDINTFNVMPPYRINVYFELSVCTLYTVHCTVYNVQ